MPKANNARRLFRYSHEFKSKVVQLSWLEGATLTGTAKTFGIHRMMLSRWRKDYREGRIVTDKRKKIVDIKKEQDELTKIKQLEKENARLKMEVDLLKKWQRFLAEERQKGIDASRNTEAK